MYRDVRPVAESMATASTPENWAKNFAASKPLNAWRRRRYASLAEARLIERYIPRGATIVDAGSGFGEWVAFLNERGYEARGVDYSPELIARVRATYPHLQWYQGDVRQLPFDDSSVDAVISWGVIEHDEAGPAAALRDFHRIIKPGGHAIVTVPINTEVARKSTEIIHRTAGSEHAFFQYLMSEKELAQEGAAVGFEVVSTGSLPSAHLAHFAPRLSLKLPGLLYRVANLAVYWLLSWTPRYRVMIYAVLRKPRQ
jgi:SAM-dependent methyltransferase